MEKTSVTESLPRNVPCVAAQPIVSNAVPTQERVRVMCKTVSLLSGVLVFYLGAIAHGADNFSMTWSVAGETRDANYDGVAESIDNHPFASVVGNADWESGERRTIMEFSLTSITQPTIQTARLELKANWYTWYQDHPQGGVIQLYSYRGDGSATASDHARLDNLVWSGVSDSNAPPLYGDLSIDVTAPLQNLINSGATYAGFVLENSFVDGPEDKAGRGWYIESSSGIPSTSYVELHGTAVPEPTTLFLALSAVAVGVATRTKNWMPFGKKDESRHHAAP
jgi:hypothetical protein